MKRRLRRAFLAGGLAVACALACAAPGLAQDKVTPIAPAAPDSGASDNAVISGGSAPGQPTVKVHADGSGALFPEKPRTAEGSTAAAGSTPDTAVGDAPVSGGFAPQGGAAPGASGGTAPKPVASGGASSGALDYQGWERMATRAEAAISNPNLGDVALENLRLELTRWREQLQGAQNANSTRIATLKDQISALGPAPAEGATEAPEIATRRAELNARMGRLQAPGIAADEAYQRADGLIREIDRVMRERQANELLKLWPNPLYPGNWTDAASGLTQTVKTIGSETLTRIGDSNVRKRALNNLPLILTFLVFAIAMLWRGRHWVDWLVSRLQGKTTARGRRIGGFLASLGVIVVPVLGCMALTEALQLSGVLGMVGLLVAGVLGQMGFALFSAIWLGARIFPVAETEGSFLNLPPERRAEGRFLTTSFGALLAIALVRRTAMAEIEVSDAATSVLVFPIILIGALLLVRLGHLLRQVRTDTGDEGRANYNARLISILARATNLVGIVGPLLAAVGYISAASALVFPTAMTLGLIALLFLMQQLVSDLYALITRAEGDQDALAPVLIGFGLALAMLPVVALIWGARTSDLTEIWTRFQEGYQLGETRISPTDFLFFAVVFGIGYSATRLVQGALKTTILPRTGLDHGGQNAIVSGVGYLGIMLAALIAINSTGIDLSGLAIVAGALSVGIGFGLQAVVSNFVSGIILLIERPVSEGDWIEVGPVQGIVSSISVRSTRIQTFDRSDVIVPNSDLISGRVTNWTRFSLTGRLIVAVTVPLTEDSRKVAAILREIAEAQPLVLLAPPPMIAFIGPVGEVLQFEIRVILRDVNFQVAVRTEINHQIAERFRAENIPFTYLHRDYLKRRADEEAAEADAVAEEAANIAAVEAILGAPLPPEARRLPPPAKEEKPQ
jgi:small-conductance mechanosensitive channel